MIRQYIRKNYDENRDAYLPRKGILLQFGDEISALLYSDYFTQTILFCLSFLFIEEFLP